MIGIFEDFREYMSVEETARFLDISVNDVLWRIGLSPSSPKYIISKEWGDETLIPADWLRRNEHKLRTAEDADLSLF